MIDESFVKRQITEGESLHQEFKEARSALPKSFFETVCAFLNREGGRIFLGVTDKGELAGVEESSLDKMCNEITALSNNPQKIDPPFILCPEKHTINGKAIVRIQIPESSSVHKTAGVIYDRGGEGDFRINSPEAVAVLVQNKRLHYSENSVFPSLTLRDFDTKTIEKTRNLIRSYNAVHPWLKLGKKEFFNRAGLFRKEPVSGKQGFTLAAVLLFGKNDIIRSIVPHYKTDALVRRENISRYDDRLTIECNLIDAYDELMAFIGRHLPDPFYLEGTQRINLRSKIFREVIANLLIHREYTNAHPATLVIYQDRVETLNANHAYHTVRIDPAHFIPCPKNPSIARMFTQMGRSEELGSGIVNIIKYLQFYSPGAKPRFEEGPFFKTTIPLREELFSEQKISGDTEGVNEGVKTVLECITHHPLIRLPMIAEKTGIPLKTAEKHIRWLKEHGKIIHVGANKTGGYQTVDTSKKE